MNSEEAQTDAPEDEPRWMQVLRKTNAAIIREYVKRSQPLPEHFGSQE